MAAVGASDFYAERTDFRRDDTSEFVRAEIIPLLGKILGAACTYIGLASRLHGWFDALPEPATIMYDFLIDWQLLQAAFAGDLPSNVATHQLVDHKIFRHSAYKLGEVLVYTATWPPYHALADAQALREGYLRWQPAMSGARMEFTELMRPCELILDNGKIFRLNANCLLDSGRKLNLEMVLER